MYFESYLKLNINLKNLVLTGKKKNNTQTLLKLIFYLSLNHSFKCLSIEKSDNLS